MESSDKDVPAVDEIRYTVPAESSSPNATSLAKNTKQDSQMAFDLSTNAYKEVVTLKLNMTDRDEHRLNTNVQTNFLYIFGEPGEHYHSVACVWTSSYRVFELTRIYGYKILTLFLAIPVAFLAGFVFALFAFLRIWIVQPLLVLMRMVLRQVITAWPMCLIYIFRPFFYSVGAMFSTIRFHRSDGIVIKEQWETV